jgi:hypothetical protein
MFSPQVFLKLSEIAQSFSHQKEYNHLEADTCLMTEGMTK